MSLIESVTNVGVGFSLAVLTQLIAFPRFGVRIGASEHLLLGVVFTLVSLVRSYTLRRLFESLRGRHPHCP